MQKKYMPLLWAVIAVCLLIPGKAGNCEEGGILIAKGNGVITLPAMGLSQ